MVTIRAARPEDAAAAAACHVACWREAYAAIVEPALLATHTSDLEARTRKWRSMLGAGASRWLAVRTDGLVVGLAAVGAGRDPQMVPSCELEAIYVRASEWGHGLGDRLLAAAIGAQPAYLWVFEANLRARRFYARHGFVADGSRKMEPRFEQPEIRMVRGAPAPLPG